jgi:hypothetical protein
VREGNGYHLNKVTKDNYIGTFLNNRKHGKGRMIYGDGSTYSGDFAYDVPHGEGSF